MDVLVTGGTVFVSRAVAEYFAARGDRVFVMNRGNRLQPKNTTLIRADRHCLTGELKSYCFDGIIDMTAYSADDVRQLIRALGGFKDYILLSSSAVYPETLAQPFREVQPVGPNRFWGSYGVGKIDAESELLRLFPASYILRPPYLCGKGNNLYREAFVFECVERGIPVYLPGGTDLQLQFCCISELCKLIERILVTKPATHILNVGDPNTVSAEDWIQICANIANRQCEICYANRDIPVRDYFPFRDYSYQLDVSDAIEISPYSTTLSESLRSGHEWWTAHRDEVVRKPYIEYIASHFR